jgi:DNA-binding MarR family transcriptional regulator
MVPLLTELGARGLISRRPSDSDRRAQVVTLTPAGKKLTATLLEMHARLENDLVQSLGEKESAQLVELLKKFRTLSTGPDLADSDSD